MYLYLRIYYIFSCTQYLNLLYPKCLQCPQSNSGCPDKISRASKVIWREFLNPHPLTKLPFWAASSSLSSLSSYYESFPQSKVFSCIKCERRSTWGVYLAAVQEITRLPFTIIIDIIIITEAPFELFTSELELEATLDFGGANLLNLFREVGGSEKPCWISLCGGFSNVKSIFWKTDEEIRWSWWWQTNLSENWGR